MSSGIRQRTETVRLRLNPRMGPRLNQPMVSPPNVRVYRRWQSLDLQVRKGETGYRILAPMTRRVKVDRGDSERSSTGWSGSEW